MRRTSILLCVAAMAAQLAAAASPDENFRDCFKWDQATDSFQGGSKWYNSDACQHYFLQAFGFAIPAVIGLFVLLFFPCLFYASRYWCACCGGRHRTFGICCSDESSRHRFPGYSNRSIFLAKVLMCAVFGGYVYYSVGGYESNAKFHNKILDALGDLDGAVDNLNSGLQQALKEGEKLSTLPQQIVPRAFVGTLNVISQKFGNRTSQIHNALNDVREYENNESYGRKESVYRYPSCVLFCLFLIVILMFCNVRKAMGPLMVLVCLTSIVEGIVFIPHMVIAQGATAMCDNFNQTVVPVVVAAVQNQRGCSDREFMAGMNASAARLELLFWFPNNQTSIPPVDGLCPAMQTVCSSFNCTYTTCAGVGVNGRRLPFHLLDSTTPFNIRAMQLVVTTPFFGSKNSIQTCASGASCEVGTAEYQSARQLMQFYNSSYASLAYLFDEAYPATNNCAAVRAALQNPLESDVCTDINRYATTVALMTGVLYLLSFLSLPIIARGMKRFEPLKRNQGIADVAKETILYADAQVNAIPAREVEGDIVAPAHSGYGAINAEDGAARSAADAAYMRRFGPTASYGEPTQALLSTEFDPVKTV